MEKGGSITCNSGNIAPGTPCSGKNEWDTVNNLSPATEWIALSIISSHLKEAWMSSIPTDPLKWKVSWLWNFSGNDIGDYAYLVATRNWTEKWWFALMAKTEVVWWSNWVVCTGTTDNGKLTNESDLANIRTCEDITKWICKNDNQWNCQYANDSELRYLVTY